MSRVRVVVVDDSPTMRGLIIGTLRRDPHIDVVGSAGDPYEAREVIKAQNPDVITLDVEMPNMSGVEFLEKLMRLRPMPVVMVSTLTHKGAEVAVEALRIGAVDCVGKPADGDFKSAFADLPDIVKNAARARPRHQGMLAQAAAPASFRPNNSIIAIGASTGGVEALISVLSAFPINCPPTVITQHMPAGFTASFASRLNQVCAPAVSEATDGAPLEIGRVYVAPGGGAHLEISGSDKFVCRLRAGDPVSGHRPSVDVLFSSVARAAQARSLGVILTGMGRDGARGLLAIREAGGETIGQDEASCIVYGMPKAAHELGAVARQAPLSKIAVTALSLCDAGAKRVA
jgi:two-component system chemotaxis response regulator CheB